MIVIRLKHSLKAGRKAPWPKTLNPPSGQGCALDKRRIFKIAQVMTGNFGNLRKPDELASGECSKLGVVVAREDCNRVIRPHKSHRQVGGNASPLLSGLRTPNSGRLIHEIVTGSLCQFPGCLCIIMHLRL